MSTTYTTNYHLGKQTDTSDTFDMSVITDDMDIIDTQMKNNETNILSNTIDFNSYVRYNGDSSRPSVNMYNYTTAAANTRLSSSGTSKGRPKSAEGYHLTDYIAVSENDVLFGSFAGIGTNVNGYCTYNEDKVCIDYHTFFGAPNGGTTITDEGTAFIRIEMKDTLGDYTKYQVQKNEVTPLEPYGELVYYKGNRTVKIKSDGTGDYSSIRTAFETEGENVIYEIYEGTYNIEDYFTPEEIANASYDSSGSGFVGLRVPNNSKIIGVGNKSCIILHLTLDEAEYSYMVRSNIATLNLFGTCHIENLTIIAENARTPIHDDFRAAANSIHTILNCDLKNIVVERTTSHGYGLGLRSGLTVNIENCTIYPTMIIHSNTNFAASATVNMNNTAIYSTLSISDAASVSDTDVNLYNTSYGMLVFIDSNDNNKMHLTVNTSCRNPVVADRIEGSLIIKAPAKESIGKSKLITLNIDSHDIVHAYATQTYDKRCVGISMSAVEAGGETYIFTLDKYVPLSLCGIENANVGDKIAYSNGEFSIVQSGNFGEVIQYGSQMIIALD